MHICACAFATWLNDLRTKLHNTCCACLLGDMVSSFQDVVKREEKHWGDYKGLCALCSSYTQSALEMERREAKINSLHIAVAEPKLVVKETL